MKIIKENSKTILTSMVLFGLLSCGDGVVDNSVTSSGGISTTGFLTQLGATTHAASNPASVNQGNEVGYAVAVDSSGNSYLAGYTSGNLSEVNAGGNDAYVMKLNSSGVIEWVTQLGATTHAASNPASVNQGSDFCFGVSVDSSGNVYCAGYTTGNLSEVNAGGNDAFVMKLNSSGVIQWVTQLGATTHAASNPASVNQGNDVCAAVSVDSSGNVYCAGNTSGNLSEVNAGGLDAFVMKLNSSGAIQWVTQLGATTHAASNPASVNQGNDVCVGVSVDSTGNVYCAGRTAGNLSEVNAGSNDAFVMKLNSSGAIQWITQLGATTHAASNPASVNQGNDVCTGGVTVDSSGNVYCAGKTSGNLSEVNGGGGFTDAFVMKLDSSGAIQWVTQLGATTHAASNPASVNQGAESCFGVSVDSSGNVYCAGSTTGNLSEVNAGNDDVFVMKLNSSGAIQWLTQLGATTHAPSNPASVNQGGDFCNGVKVDSSGNVYCGGNTSANLGEVNGGGGQTDAFILKLSPTGTLP